MPTTSIYALPYQALTDPPHGPDLGRNLAEKVETELSRIDAVAGATNADVAALVKPYRATTTLAAAAANITFSGIPSNLKMVDLRWTARSTDLGFQAQTIWMRINGASTSSVYRTTNIQSANASTTVANYTGAGVPGGAAAHLGLTATAGAAAGVFGNGNVRFDAWNAPHTNNLGWHYETYLAPNDTSSTIWMTAGSGVYTGAGPYTSITLFPVLGNFDVGTQATLIGWA